MLSSIIYCHAKLQLWDEGVHDMKCTIWKKDEPVPKLWMKKLRLSTRTVMENETDLKEKRLFSPRQLTFWLIVNVKNMNVILPRLRLVPINRWTVTPYCSRWLVITRTSFSDFYLLSSQRYKCNLILLISVHDHIMIIWWLDIIIHVFFYVSVHILTYWNDEGMSFHDLRLKIIMP
jgi:hypothetical protein